MFTTDMDFASNFVNAEHTSAYLLLSFADASTGSLLAEAVTHLRIRLAFQLRMGDLVQRGEFLDHWTGIDLWCEDGKPVGIRITLVPHPGVEFARDICEHCEDLKHEYDMLWRMAVAGSDEYEKRLADKDAQIRKLEQQCAGKLQAA